MTEAEKQADELAALRAEVEALKAKVDPPQSTFVEESDAEWINRMHQMREGRMSLAMPPSVVRDMNVLGEDVMKGVRGDARAPTGPGSAIPQQVSKAREAPGSGTGWQAPIPLSNPPGTNWVDAIAIADDARQRAERQGK
jgi:hypothetical protein